MCSETRSYKGHWVRCVARATPEGRCDCEVYVFVSEPADDSETPQRPYFHTTLRGFSTNPGAIHTGFAHAQGIIDRSLEAAPSLAAPRH
jgi:hypothetical protein